MFSAQRRFFQTLLQSIDGYFEMREYERYFPTYTLKAYDTYVPGKREVLRDILVLELLFATDLRVSKLRSLPVETSLLGDTEFQLLVNEKGRKERMIQITTPELVQVT